MTKEFKFKIGMYIRTYDGISKIIEVRDKYRKDILRVVDTHGNIYFPNDILCNPSFDIVDLIRPDDLVLVMRKKLPPCFEPHKGDSIVYLLNVLDKKNFREKYKIRGVITKEQIDYWNVSTNNLDLKIIFPKFWR